MNIAVELLRRRNKVILDVGRSNEVTDDQIKAFIFDLSQLGYTIDGSVIQVLKTNSLNKFKGQCEMLIHNLKVLKGANVKYRPLFKDFPNVNVDDFRLLEKRIVGFIQNLFGIKEDQHQTLSCGHFINTSLFDLEKYGACPICLNQVDELDSSDDHLSPIQKLTPTQIISVGSEGDVWDVFRNLLSSKTPISETDIEFVSYMVASRRDQCFTYIPNEITIKENIALILTLTDKYCDDLSRVNFGFVKTATDVLRVAVGFSGGDISLKENTRFKLSNSKRRLILSLLNGIKYPLEDMLRHRMKWIRLGEVLHAGSYKNRYPNAYEAFDILRNSEKTIETFNRKIEAFVKRAVKQGSKVPTDNFKPVLKLLESRPSDFARRLDTMLRMARSPSIVVHSFSRVISSVSTPILLCLSAHFRNRDKASGFRAFVPKGVISNIQFEEGDNRGTISRSICDKVMKAIDAELLQRFANKDMNNVFIDPALKGLIVPFSQRSASKSISTVERGSRIKLDADCDVVRMFTYWKESGGRVDLDLSAVAYDKSWNYQTHVSYTNLSAYGTKHSGDITSAPRGAAEFIDVDLAKIRSKGVRYLVMNLISYNNQPFNTFECFSGIMERNKGDGGRRFEPKTVKTKFDITGDYKYNIPLILDVENNEFVWADYSVKSSLTYRNVENNAEGIVAISRYASSLIDNKYNLFDLFNMYCQANGAKVDLDFDDSKEYDHVFDVEKASQFDEIMANWL